MYMSTVCTTRLGWILKCDLYFGFNSKMNQIFTLVRLSAQLKLFIYRFTKFQNKCLQANNKSSLLLISFLAVNYMCVFVKVYPDFLKLWRQNQCQLKIHLLAFTWLSTASPSARVDIQCSSHTDSTFQKEIPSIAWKMIKGATTVSHTLPGLQLTKQSTCRLAFILEFSHSKTKPQFLFCLLKQHWC